MAVFPAQGKIFLISLIVNALHLPVDPSKAERFFPRRICAAKRHFLLLVEGDESSVGLMIL